VAMSDLSVAPTEFCAALDMLGIAPRRLAQLFSIDERSVRRWRDGGRRVPRGVAVVVGLLVAKVATLEEVEQVAIRANGSAGLGAPAALPVAPAVEPSVVAPAEAAAGIGPSTAETVAALTDASCHWPHGDPGAPGFYFCGAPVAQKPYCPRHHSVAYWTLPTWQRAGRPHVRGQRAWGRSAHGFNGFLRP
jgi:hypothetical protein